MNKLIIDAIGESTSVGYYDYLPHPGDLEACIPLMVKNAVEAAGIPCEMHNKAVHATSVDWHLGRVDGDELIWEPPLPEFPSSTPYELAKSNSNMVIVNLALNDAVGGTIESYFNDYAELIDNFNRTGKIVYAFMPNTITGPNSLDVIANTGVINYIADFKNIKLVNHSAVDVVMDDMYHPVPGDFGYIELGKDIIDAVTENAQEIINKVTIAQYYVAINNRTPEIGGLNYWVDQLNTLDKNLVAQNFIDFVNPNFTDSEFISLLYSNVLGRSPDAGGEVYWQGRLDTVNNGTVLNEFINCVEGHPLFQNKTSVAMAYGAVYEVEEIAPDNNLDLLGITEDFNSVYDATGDFYG